MRVRILGIGMGPGQLTPDVADALGSVDYVIAADKGPDDPLLSVRRVIAQSAGVPLVAVPDPERDRDSPSDYRGAVVDWHERRVAAYEEVLRARGGTAAFLVWGDPSLYDSSIRVVASLATRLSLEWDVLPGISAPQLLAARHRIVLHPIGMPVHITTARLLPSALAAGQRNIVVMLGSVLELAGLEDWTIWWGANLGTPSEQLVTGRVGVVRDAIDVARERARADAGWVMDVYLLRGPS